MDRNHIFIDRTRDVGVISTADAINWGFTGPILRSTGAALICRDASRVWRTGFRGRSA
jgi:NADH-quinone oxidoreductase subunit D